MRIASTFLTWFLLLPACGGGGDDPDAAPVPDAYIARGTVSLSWTLSDGALTIPCDRVGAATVSVRLIPTTGGAGSVEAFTCPSAMGTSGELPVGNYRVEAVLAGPAGTMVTENLGIHDVVDRQDTNLGAVEFVLSTQGSISFRLGTDAPGNNCETASFGAGLTSVEMRLMGGGMCSPVTFTDMAGTQTLCDAACNGTPCACTESDVVFHLLDAPSGPYTLELTGNQDNMGTPAPCYLASSQFTIPGADLVDDLGTLTLLFQTDNGDCTAPQN